MTTATANDVSEHAVLYAVLTDPACIAEIADTLAPSDFGTLDYGTIYSAMIACHSRGQRPDMVTVSDELRTRGDTRLADDVYHIPGESDAWVSSLYIAEYAGRVVKHSRRRAVIRHATDLIAELHRDHDADPVEAAHRVLSTISDLSDGDDGPVLYADVIEQLQERLTLQAAGEWEERVFRLEHGVATFIIQGVSRSCTHELIRHRHLSPSQLSQRYVDESDAATVLPDLIAAAGLTHVFDRAVKAAQDAYDDLVIGLGAYLAETAENTTGTERRKAARQAARAVLPNAVETKIQLTGNFRAWRHFIGMRASRHADVEIRALAVEILRQLQAVSPHVFSDFAITTLPDGTEVASSKYQAVT